jgi:hypothetical protein
VRLVACYMSERDFQKFDEAYKSTLCRNRSQYVRKMLLGKPVTVHLRNRSLDEFIEIAVKIRKDFAAILSMPSLTASEKQGLRDRIDQIQIHIIKVVESCSQE